MSGSGNEIILPSRHLIDINDSDPGATTAARNRTRGARINKQHKRITRMKTPLTLHFTQWAALIGGLAAFPAAPLLGQITFTGVAAGDATTTDAVLWTRAVDTSAPAAAALTALVAPNDPTVTTGVVTFSGSTDPAKDYTAKVIASNLQPNTRYYYRFAASTDPLNISIIGTFKTAPDANSAVPVRFAFSGDADGLM